MQPKAVWPALLYQFKGACEALGLERPQQLFVGRLRKRHGLACGRRCCPHVPVIHNAYADLPVTALDSTFANVPYAPYSQRTPAVIPRKEFYRYKLRITLATKSSQDSKGQTTLHCFSKCGSPPALPTITAHSSIRTTVPAIRLLKDEPPVAVDPVKIRFHNTLSLVMTI